MRKDNIIKRLEYAIHAMNLANQWALGGKNYLIGSVDINGVEEAIKFISEKKVKIVCGVKTAAGTFSRRNWFSQIPNAFMMFMILGIAVVLLLVSLALFGLLKNPLSFRRRLSKSSNPLAGPQRLLPIRFPNCHAVCLSRWVLTMS
jgi:hypothetical protein